MITALWILGLVGVHFLAWLFAGLVYKAIVGNRKQELKEAIDAYVALHGRMRST